MLSDLSRSGPVFIASFIYHSFTLSLISLATFAWCTPGDTVQEADDRNMSRKWSVILKKSLVLYMEAGWDKNDNRGCQGL